ncbi:transglycosylase family protein [Streptomyces sp. ID05-04B]|uniref:LysM peptidoglycan-binding domain-containing protein n=1 Tax=unclassified Streptomyces TaxID=2593676 RepID=UPI000D1A8847|nr:MULTISPECIES: transglycosylase family protein [unclassified Streptomyces]AVV42235.1 peptigoglycan-binding protein LysM [Streptomyces sp. P3]MDX5567424.1 transglycosylase family protein [Streptomyces sp. ID05-04B]
MLSGNGRHRRPRQAPALLVAAGVTGSAIAIPLFAASGASAADGTVWDKVAQCETGGSWSADGVGGESGGLSLTQQDWNAYGGLDYAASPDLASRNQQIAVAQKVLAAKGVGAWGTCGLTSGLTKENGALAVDTGVAGDSSESSGSSGLSDLSRGLSGSSGSSSSSDSGGSTGSGDSSGSTGSSDSPDSSGDSTSSPSASPSSPSSPSAVTGDSDGAGRQGGPRAADGSPTGTPEAVNPDKSGQEAGSWNLVDTGSLGSGRHRGTTADEPAAKGADIEAGGASTASAGRHAAATYVVQEGDSLASIADSLGLHGGWRALYAENKDVIGADPSDIAPGQTLDTGVQ